MNSSETKSSETSSEHLTKAEIANMHTWKRSPKKSMLLNKNQIVVLGAGYGGLRTALKLGQLLREDTDWRVLLIDRYDFHQLKTELHEVAAGRTSAEAVTVPIAKLVKNTKIHFFKTEAVNIDFDHNIITTTDGKIRYEKLVIALGSETEYFGIPDLSRKAFTLSSVDDAKLINTHLRDIFAQAKNEANKAKRTAMLTVVVGGGGYTGVEIATELVDYIARLRKQFTIAPTDTQLIVVEAGDTILPGFDLELIRRAQQFLKRKEIRLLLKTRCISVTDDSVDLKAGPSIQTATLIWTGGVKACDLVAESGLKYGPRSRVVVNPFLESVDHPGVYVIGDNALVIDPVTNRPLGPTAQLALQQADFAALNIYAEIRGNKRVRYVPTIVGQFVSLGGRNAVGWVWKFKVTGLLAWFLKRLTVVRYLYSIGGLRLMISKLSDLFFS